MGGLLIGLSCSFVFFSNASKNDRNLVGREELLKIFSTENTNTQIENPTKPTPRNRIRVIFENPPPVSLPESNNTSPEVAIPEEAPKTESISKNSNTTNSTDFSETKTTPKSYPAKKTQNSKSQPNSSEAFSNTPSKSIRFSGVAPTFHPVTGFQKYGTLNTFLNNGLFGEVKPISFPHNYPSLFSPVSPITLYTPPTFNSAPNYFAAPIFVGASPVVTHSPQTPTQVSPSSQKKDSRPCLEACNAMISAYANQSFVEGFQMLSKDKTKFSLNIRSDVNQNWSDIQALDSAAEQKIQFEKMCKGGVAMNLDNKNKKQTNIYFRETESLSSDMKKQIEACKSNMKMAAQTPTPSQKNPEYTNPTQVATPQTNTNSNYKYDMGGGKAPMGEPTATYKLVEPGPPGPNGEWAPGTHWEKVTPQNASPTPNPAAPAPAPAPTATAPTTTRALAAFPKN